MFAMPIRHPVGDAKSPLGYKLELKKRVWVGDKFGVNSIEVTSLK
jgi:hypothetical protein